MAELKIKRTRKSVARFLAGVEHDGRRGDARTVLALMKAVSGEKPEMWGENIVGFGSYGYRYASSREGEWSLAGSSSARS